MRTNSTLKTPALTTPELLTTAEVCDVLKVHRSTLYKWWERGDGPERMRLPNGSARVHRTDLDEFLYACEVAAR